VSDENSVSSPTQRGATVWLTGLPSAGKSTIAHGCEPELRARGLRVEVLDGDAVRPHLAAARGYSRDDRAINIRRIGWVSELLARNGVLVLVSAIAPFRDVRGQVRAAHEANGTAYLEVHVSTPVEVAAERDVKGLYARQRAGEVSGLTGVDDEYEAPQHPDLVIPTHEHSVDESVSLLVDHLVERGITERPHPGVRDADHLRRAAEHVPQPPSTDEHARSAP
jgi:adenylylsulfate kinase